MTEKFLRRMIGVQRNAVSIAHALQQADVIRYRQGRIEITDVQVCVQV